MWGASGDSEILENNCPVVNLLHGLMSGTFNFEEWGICIISHAQFMSEYLKLWLAKDFIAFPRKMELREFVIYMEIQKFKCWGWQIWSIFLTNKGEKHHFIYVRHLDIFYVRFMVWPKRWLNYLYVSYQVISCS